MTPSIARRNEEDQSPTQFAAALHISQRGIERFIHELPIGVEDRGEILGIEADQFQNEDKYLLHFNNLIKQHIGLEHAARISVAIRSVKDKRILIVDCERSPEPVFLLFGENEEFFVRVGSGTRQLPASKVLEYVKKR